MFLDLLNNTLTTNLLLLSRGSNCCVAKQISIDAGESGVSGAVQSPALSAMAVAEVGDVAVDLKLNLIAFATPVNHELSCTALAP